MDASLILSLLIVIGFFVVVFVFTKFVIEVIVQMLIFFVYLIALAVIGMLFALLVFLVYHFIQSI
jgi:hypothetical protein